MNESTTIGEAKLKLFNSAHEGTYCPCCESLVKIYRRTISGKSINMLSGLYNLAKAETGRYFHLSKVLRNSGQIQTSEFPKLRFWGLIKRLDIETDNGSNHSGHYSITQKGVDFLLGRLKIPKYASVYKNEVQEMSKELVTVYECRANKFHFQDLMKNGYS